MNLEFIRPFIKFLPEVSLPKRHVPFKEKLMWTAAVLLLFFIMGTIYPVGITPEELSKKLVGFEQMQIIFASKIGTIISAGIGPIVTASIVLQLLIGSKMIDIDLTTDDGKALFQGTQKILTILIAFFEAAALVMGMRLVEDPVLITFAIFQIGLGSILLMYMDEIVSKWGIGSGIGLFIAGGVSQEVVYKSISTSIVPGTNTYAGIIPNAIAVLTKGSVDMFGLLTLIFPVFATIIVFIVVAYGESMRLEIPLSYGGIRGVGGRYPIKFFYVSNIPVILAAALLMNIRMWTNFAGVDISKQLPESASIFQKIVYYLGKNLTLGELNGLFSPDEIDRLIHFNAILHPMINFIDKPLDFAYSIIDLGLALHLIIYLVVFIVLCIVFGKFWIETTGMGPEQVAEQIQQGGMQIPGFRRDKRVIERVLNRYIPQITIISSVAVGLLAVVADLMGALGSGTGILLTVGILYRLYEEIQREQMSEMHPVFRRFMGR